MEKTLPRRVTLSSQVLFQQLESEAVLLDLDSEHYYSLDPVATRIWKLLSEDGSVETAVSSLLATYDIDETTLRRDLFQPSGRDPRPRAARIDVYLDRRHRRSVSTACRSRISASVGHAATARRA